MATLILKTEPGEYSFDDLLRDKRTTWSGISNPGALITLRAAKRGDEALIYHTGAERAIVGVAKVLTPPTEDPQRPGRTPDGQPKFAVVDIAPVRRVPSPLTLEAMKTDPRFADFALLRQGRLSVVPVPPKLDAAIRSLCGL
jgi:predicted RNA-binding protein with PUA-like domain